MRTVICRITAMGRAVCFVASVIVFTSITASAQTNSWINPTSGKWEDASSWSLGVPPGAGQSVFVTNHGWKAVSIDNSTVANFPQTLSISSLWIMSPGTDTVNTVLMNYAGLQTPLNASDVEVSNNTSMVILQSAVQAGYFGVGTAATVTEDASSQVSLSQLLSVSGTYYLTNGTLYVTPANGSAEAVGGQFVQAGGSNFCGSLLVFGEYDLSGGQLVLPPAGNSLEAVLDFGNFVQSGGSVHSTVVVGESGNGGGNYQLSGGFINADYLAVPVNPDTGSDTTPDVSYMSQTGGTNVAGFMDVGQEYGFGNPSFGLGYYSLTNGLLVSGTLRIDGQGNFYQYGGVHSNASMSLSQTELSTFTNYFVPAHYYLYGGTFTSSSVSGQSSVFAQTGGMAQIATLGIGGGQYSLTSGQLTVSNMVLSGGANFLQSGGTVTQTGTLQLADAGLTLGPGAQQLGRLYVANSTSMLRFSPGSTVLHFANSSSQAWSGASIFTISNWNGSLSGGGEDQVFFGGDSTGLTAQQLSQVQFVNPAGLPSGTYPAQILSDGEVVPSQGSSSSGPVNSWINPASGNWQDATSWSLGVLPGAAQTILITNGGWKAVAINSTTAQNYPDSLKIAALTVSSPGTNTVNTLLLNYVGAGNPLVIGSTNNPGSLIIGDTNSAMRMFSSGLIVNNALGTNNSRQGEFKVDGTFVQSDNAEVVAGFLDLSYYGTYSVTNGMVFIGNQFITGRFNQQGGTNLGTVTFSDGGEYDLFDGVLEGHVGLDSQYGNGFKQSGGTNISTLDFDGGVYLLSGGLLVPGDMVLGPSYFSPFSFAAGGVEQTGGTNNAGNITMGVAGYNLEGGLLTASNLTLPTVDDRYGSFGSSFTQSGGYFSSGSVNMSGAYDSRYGLGPATYTLSGGELATPAINMTMGLMNQTGGTNSVGVITLNTASSYVLNGGVLIVSNLTQNGQTAFSLAGSIQQSGGTNQVLGTLFLGGNSSYDFTNGLLLVTNIQLAGQAVFVSAGGSFGGLNNINILLAGGGWVERTAGHYLGQLQLGSSASSSLNLPPGTCLIRFADSSGVPWASDGRLTISNYNWPGTSQQIFFGGSASGLTAQQLSQVQFSNPGGLSGMYSARILSNGEVLPDQLISQAISYSRQGNKLVLTWPTGWTLQSATNVWGPYSNVSGATSPYTNDMTLDPQRFFRLGQ